MSATWLDLRCGEITLVEWAQDWLPTRHDLRATTCARLETTMERQVLPRLGSNSGCVTCSRMGSTPPVLRFDSGTELFIHAMNARPPYIDLIK